MARAAGPHIRRRRRYPDMLVGRLIPQALGDERLVAARERRVGSAVYNARTAAYLHHAFGSRWRSPAHDAVARAAGDALRHDAGLHPRAGRSKARRGGENRHSREEVMAFSNGQAKTPRLTWSCNL